MCPFPRETTGEEGFARKENQKLAEGRGFEPLETCAPADFKSAAFDHSASPPTAINYNEFW
jgi:hypothetical protein